MVPFSKFIIRGAVIGALGVGAAVVIAGPDRIGSLFTQARASVNDRIDRQITDPVALRAQLRDLQGQYPRRIGEVRSDLSQLREQQAQLQRDLAVSSRVVELADADMDKISAALTHAHAAQVQAASFDGADAGHRVVIVFKNEKLEIDQAQARSNQIAATRNAYAQRIADIQRDLGYLSQQERQMTQLLAKLEAEQMSFQTQMFDLDRQIDAIARNDRMIDIIKDRQDTLEEQSRYRAASLDQITSRLADIRARQEATLESLSRTVDHFSYEDAAKADIDRDAANRAREGSGSGSPRLFTPARQKNQPAVIEINPDNLPATPTVEQGPVAANR